tara:strand:+ start:2722 stop:3816 length:1095 start_codon:yes stop_codon:yes gene_type:complete
MPHEVGHTFSFQDDPYGGHDFALISAITGMAQGASQQAVIAMLDDHPEITLDNYYSILFGSDIMDDYMIGEGDGGDEILEDLYEDSGFSAEDAEDAVDSIDDTLDPNVFQGSSQTLAGGLGAGGLDWESMQNMSSEDIFNLLKTKGLIDEGEVYNEAWEDKIATIPKFSPYTEEDLAYAQVGVEQDAYGFQTDIDRAGEDKTTAQDAYALTEARGKEDITSSGISARSDIYGLQGQGAQQKRAGMFGKGMGGGMSQLNQQDASNAMRASGQSVMQGLASNVRGLNRGITDAGLARDASIRGYNREISDATTGLYGVGGTGMNDLGEGGIYGSYGSMGKTQYNLEQEDIAEWEAQMPQWLLDALD